MSGYSNSLTSPTLKMSGFPLVSNEQKKEASDRCRKNKPWIDKKTGKNVATLPRVRRHISDSKMGLKNPHAKLWKLVSPLGEEFIIEGGIKREIKKYGVDYQQFEVRNGGSKIDERTSMNHRGWKLYSIKKDEISP